MTSSNTCHSYSDCCEWQNVWTAHLLLAMPRVRAAVLSVVQIGAFCHFPENQEGRTSGLLP